MTSVVSGRRQRRRFIVAQIAAAVLVATTALLAFLRPLAFNDPTPDLDGGWVAVLGEAARIPARWGVDLVFSYGPASALVTRYFTSDHLRFALPLAGGAAAAFGLAVAHLVARAGRETPDAPLSIATASVAVAGMLVGAARHIPDPFFFALPFAQFLLDVGRPRRGGATAAILAAGAFVTGAVALSKSGYGLLAAALFLIGDLHGLLRVRRPPIALPLFLGGFLLAYVWFGQRLEDLPTYLRLQGEVAAGYGEAMYLVGSRAERLGFLLAAAGLLAAATAAAAFTAGRAGTVAIAAGTVIALVVALKAGFIRQDEHTEIAWTFLGFACVLVAVAVVLPRFPIAAMTLAAVGLSLVTIVAPLMIVDETTGHALRRSPAATLADATRVTGDEIAAWRNLAANPKTFLAAAEHAKAEAWAGIREDHPLPRLDGTVDILPSAQTWVMAAQLDYHPRPSFQDYSTYTAGLIAANERFYAGDRAPDWVLFGAEGLDDRYPAMSEGALWPLLMARYEPTLHAGAFLALHRRPAPLDGLLGPARRVETHLGEEFAVPSGPVFAHVAVRKTLLGKLAAALFRPPALRLAITLATREARDFRFIPALGEGGFLLSPLVETTEQFALVAIGQGGDLARREIATARIHGSPAARYFYEPDIAVVFEPVRVSAAAPSAAARPLVDQLSARHAWRSLAAGIAGERSFDGDRLSASAPDTLLVPLDGARRLRLGFGMDDEAWASGHTEGVCFALRAAGNADAPLWQRCLNPAQDPGDRGPQSAEVALPEGLPAVSLSTSCRGSCDWGWSYWSDIARDP